jgi:predicted permease
VTGATRPQIRRIARACHLAALYVYPRAFREPFGRELEQVFDDRIAAAPSHAVATALAVYLVFDTIVCGLAERARAIASWWAWPRHADAQRREGRSRMSVESVVSDLRHAVRHWARSPVTAALTIASLALGIGVNSAMFAVVHAVLLQPLPYAEPQSLVMIWSDNRPGSQPLNPVSPANFEAFRSAPSLAGVEGLYSFLIPIQLRLAAEAETVQASVVSLGMFELLGRSAMLGRAFATGDSESTVVLSEAYWRRRFGGDPSVVGRTIVIAGVTEPVTVIGVMPPDFVFPYRSMLGPSGFSRALVADLWVPLSRQRDPRLVDSSGQPNRHIHYLGVLGRLAPGATADRVTADLSSIASRRATEFPDTNAGWGVTVQPLHEQAVGALRPALLILMGGVGAVLLITCINVANVLLARATVRGRELAVRSALGASGRRLIRQALTESLLLSTAGCLAGVGLMILATRAILAIAPATVPRLDEVSAGTPVLLFAVAVSLVTGLAVGALPALSAGRSRAHDSLRDGLRATASANRRRVRGALIVAEVAVATTLTIGAGLLLRSFVSVLGVDPGFRAERLLTLQIAVPTRYTDASARLAFYDELEERLLAIPGVTHVGGTTRLPLGSTNVTTMLEVDGRPLPRTEWPEVEMRRAVFDFFSAMGIPVVRGRTFTREDQPGAPAVAVVNTALAARVFPQGDAIGQRVRFGGSSGPWLTIIGVVGSVRHGSLEESPRPELYITYRQGPPVSPYLVVRAQTDAAALTSAVRQALRDTRVDPPTGLQTMEEIRSQSVGERRFVLVLVGLFGVLALVLAAFGVYGVISLVTAERTAEVGIRLALGAAPSQVLSLVLRQALALAAMGIGLGAAGALLLTPVLKSQLFGVAAVDPITYVGVAFVLSLTAMCAALVPARRAMRVDPAQALRG